MDRNDTNECLTVDDEGAGKMAGCSAAHWRRLVARGEAPAPIRLGRRRVWSRAVIVAFLNGGIGAANRQTEPARGPEILTAAVR